MAAQIVKKFITSQKTYRVMTITKHCTYKSIHQQNLFVLFWRLWCTKEPSAHSYHESNKNYPIIPSYFFHTDFHIILPSGSSCSGIISKICIPFFFPICMLHATMYYLPCCDYVNNIWWRVTDMKFTIVSSASLYSYLPLTSNIPLTNLP